MNAYFAFGSAVTDFFFSGCVVFLAAAGAPPLLRQVFIKALRSSPLRALTLASALHAFILSCCAPAKAGAETAKIKPITTRAIIFFIIIPFDIVNFNLPARCPRVSVKHRNARIIEQKIKFGIRIKFNKPEKSVTRWGSRTFRVQINASERSDVQQRSIGCPDKNLSSPPEIMIIRKHLARA